MFDFLTTILDKCDIIYSDTPNFIELDRVYFFLNPVSRYTILMTYITILFIVTVYRA